MKTELPFLSRDPDRHGNPRIYVRRNGKRIRIHEQEGTPAFARAYAEAVERLGEPPSRRKPAAALTTHPKGTLGWLGALYFQSKGQGEFLRLAKDSRRARRNDLEECFRYPLSDQDREPIGNCPLKYLTAQKMKRLIEAKDGIGAQANRRKHLSALCAWGVENNHLPTNPVRDIKAGTGNRGKGGYHTWTIPEVQQFLEHHNGPSLRARKARLALGLLLFTGARRQDMVTLGRQHCRGATPDSLGDWIRYVPKKTLYKRNNISQKPLLPVLKQIITDSSDILGDLTFLVTEYGKPFTPAGFGNWFRDRCNEAGLPGCTAHGLKKAGATIAAENGATTRQLMAMFDWETVAMAEVYTKAAEQKRLAGEGMFLISLERPSEQVEHENCRTDGADVVAPMKSAN
ncbi:MULTISPECIES: tyrosine-type recombinase/integrase [unclassified Bradyrhizobium]|uniref:tyrosine-type recombinase/integrase n=1 Tax=unclassified Bradyrhizobium TaxID=2631580 RepID=UPI0028E7248C|nr:MULTISPECIES: tyrosine-type recombinase/integrase [unclassified Bradyrhizobium]